MHSTSVLFSLSIFAPIFVFCVYPIEEVLWDFDEKYPSLLGYTKWDLLERLDEDALKEMCIEHSGTNRPAVRVEATVTKHIRHHIYYYNSIHMRMVRTDLLQCDVKFVDSEDKTTGTKTFYLAEGHQPHYVFNLIEIGEHYEVVGVCRLDKDVQKDEVEKGVSEGETKDGESDKGVQELREGGSEIEEVNVGRQKDEFEKARSKDGESDVGKASGQNLQEASKESRGNIQEKVMKRISTVEEEIQKRWTKEEVQARMEEVLRTKSGKREVRLEDEKSSEEPQPSPTLEDSIKKVDRIGVNNFVLNAIRKCLCLD